MTWNYRIFKNNTDNLFELHEAYYNSKGELCGCTVDASEFGETVDELVSILEMKLKDAQKSKNDVLVYETLKFAKWD